MRWTAEYSIGIPEIDQHHVQLVDCIRLIDEAVSAQARWSAVNAALGRLADFVRIHFAVEESLMRILGYPHLERHAEEHRGFSRELMTLQEKSLRLDVSNEMVRFLGNWLKDHIKTSDRDYATYLARSPLGAKPTPLPGARTRSAKRPKRRAAS